MMNLLSKSVSKTNQVAADLAKKLSSSNLSKQAIVIALEGELGAGKTTFVKAFAKALGIKTNITSPTFVLLKRYKLSGFNYKLLIHIDAYRLKDYKELLPLGVKEMISDPTNIILIEWADRVKEVLPKNYVKIHIDHIKEDTRSIGITYPIHL